MQTWKKCLLYVAMLTKIESMNANEAVLSFTVPSIGCAYWYQSYRIHGRFHYWEELQWHRESITSAGGVYHQVVTRLGEGDQLCISLSGLRDEIYVQVIVGTYLVKSTSALQLKIERPLECSYKDMWQLGYFNLNRAIKTNSSQPLETLLANWSNLSDPSQWTCRC